MPISRNMIETFFRVFEDEETRLKVFNQYVIPDSHGYLVKHTLPDGRILAILPLLYSRARLGVGDDTGFEVNWVWDYDSPYEAIKAFMEWNPAAQAEPTGWARHPDSRRYRPGGDPAQEYVKPEE